MMYSLDLWSLLLVVMAYVMRQLADRRDENLADRNQYMFDQRKENHCNAQVFEYVKDIERSSVLKMFVRDSN